MIIIFYCLIVEQEIEEVNLLDPILTDLSSTKAERPPMCPYGATKSAPMEISKCPVDHGAAAAAGTASQHPTAAIESAEEVDYSKLIDDVEDWLNSDDA